MQKFIKILIVAVVLFAPNIAYADYSEAVDYAMEEGIVDGYADGSFRPENKINRAEFTKIIINSVFEGSEIYGEDCFHDVANEWFAKYVCTAKRKGIIVGYADGLFHPADNISFVEAAKIIVLGFGFQIEENSEVWYRPFINVLSAKNAVPSAIVEMSQQITRGEMVEIIYRLKEPWYKPVPSATWQWQLSGDIDTNYDVDMYDIDLVEAKQSTIDKLHSRGVKVICYFSAGSYEEFRDDAEKFPVKVLGKTLEGWEDERWLDISNYQEFSSIMEERLDLAVQKKCDGVEPDNMDGYTNDTGFKITYAHQLAYAKWIAEQAHKRNLSVALKNNLDQVEDLVNDFDFGINEECFQYNECDKLLPFIEEGKAVFGVEYEMDLDDFCAEANVLRFSWLKMNYNLDGGRLGC